MKTPLTAIIIVLVFFASCCSPSSAASSPRVFLGSLVRRVGIVNFYSRLYRGIKTVLVDPFFPDFKRDNHCKDFDDNFYEFQETFAEHQDIDPISTATTTPSSFTRGGRGFYLMSAPDLATTIPSTPTFKTTAQEKEEEKENGAAEHDHQSANIISNYSSVHPSHLAKEPVLQVVHAVAAEPVTQSNFYFTTISAESTSSTAHTTTRRHPSSAYYLPRSTVPPKTPIVRELSVATVRTIDLRKQRGERPWDLTTLPRIFISSLPVTRSPKKAIDVSSLSTLPVFKDPSYRQQQLTPSWLSSDSDTLGSQPVATIAMPDQPRESGRREKSRNEAKFILGFGYLMRDLPAPAEERRKRVLGELRNIIALIREEDDAAVAVESVLEAR